MGIRRLEQDGAKCGMRKRCGASWNSRSGGCGLCLCLRKTFNRARGLDIHCQVQFGLNPQVRLLVDDAVPLWYKPSSSSKFCNRKRSLPLRWNPRRLERNNRLWICLASFHRFVVVHLRNRNLDWRWFDRILVSEKRLQQAKNMLLDANEAAMGAGGVINDVLFLRSPAASAGLQLVTK